MIAGEAVGLVGEGAFGNGIAAWGAFGVPEGFWGARPEGIVCWGIWPDCCGMTERGDACAAPPPQTKAEVESRKRKERMGLSISWRGS